MDSVAYRYFCYYMADLMAGDQFTAFDVIDYIKFRVKKNTPSKKDVARMVLRYGNIKTIGYQKSAIYQVIS